MKKKIFIAAVMAILSVCFVNVQAQFVVKIRPAIVVKSRPLAPSRSHIWIEPEYVWRNNNYVMVDGYWAPARPGFKYIPGHWKRQRGGYFWIPAHWKRF